MNAPAPSRGLAAVAGWPQFEAVGWRVIHRARQFLETYSNLESDTLLSEQEDTLTVAAIDRCLSLIEALAGEREAIELTELASKLDQQPSAVHRAITTLLERGWVVQDAETQRYALSLRLSTLAFRNLEARAVPDIVQSVLDRLAQRTREYCRLAIVEGTDLVWVARAQGYSGSLRYDPDMGQEIILHATANGKAWLSTLDEEQALQIVYSRGFEANRTLGPNSVRTIDDLRANLRRVKAQGYATSIEEAEAGTVAIAVPFRADTIEGAPVAGTLSVAGPTLRIPLERHGELADMLKSAAEEVAAIWPLRRRQRALRAPTLRAEALVS